MQIRTVHFQRLDVDHALIEKRHRYQQEKRVHFLHSLTSRNWLVCRVSPSCWRYDSQCWLQFARLRLINTLAGVIIAPIDEWTTRTQQTSVKDAHFSLWKQIQKTHTKLKKLRDIIKLRTCSNEQIKIVFSFKESLMKWNYEMNLFVFMSGGACYNCGHTAEIIICIRRWTKCILMLYNSNLNKMSKWAVDGKGEGNRAKWK